MNTTGLSGENTLAGLYREQGRCVITVDNIDWYDYAGLMMPAYLPHCCPAITRENAAQVLRRSKRFLARWDCDFGQVACGAWWYIVRSGAWSLQQCSTNNRSKIRRGCKRLSARPLSPDEVLRSGYQVCLKAEKRYDKKGFVLTLDEFTRRVEAAKRFPNALEFFGVFSGDDLVAFSENYIQSNAVFFESIWYDPDFLKSYSSYVLIDGMLDHYLNQRGFNYVSDGCRSIYHRTTVQDLLMNVFGFKKEYANLNVLYRPSFAVAVNVALPFRRIVQSLSAKMHWIMLDKIDAILRQEEIRRACKH